MCPRQTAAAQSFRVPKDASSVCQLEAACALQARQSACSNSSEKLRLLGGIWCVDHKSAAAGCLALPGMYAFSGCLRTGSATALECSPCFILGDPGPIQIQHCLDSPEADVAAAWLHICARLILIATQGSASNKHSCQTLTTQEPAHSSTLTRFNPRALRCYGSGVQP